ncbi:50S ribosomal protein L13 [Buchnera aphidicola]|uniref:Large ribosomal subunit protein uL13 n=1 Tax=Buchnera aphidicola subsp. Cinara cedri (strain Cc) TaxID=372461 RepID=RL13_BUCCC|nr:50S ribosomal protein L13 [Buchnera aphidicola]Q057I8.1 RecName: Full=Large ribosomal subunit protein uL13; AltName: Full=50S ribosomal protein L13 [Buchnera aphidicola BCc]ABJ90711.1 50S ribosomal protein L13 [Buchnera aphidicola BCc]
MKSFSAKITSIKKNWYCIDATNKILGRLASQVSIFLRGKNKPEFTPHIDVGDYIIIINASKIVVTGNKEKNKFYYHHSGYVGGIKKYTFKYMMLHHPTRIIKKAIKGMLPKGSLGQKIFKKLKVFPFNQHNLISQKPVFLNI